MNIPNSDRLRRWITRNSGPHELRNSPVTSPPITRRSLLGGALLAGAGSLAGGAWAGWQSELAIDITRKTFTLPGLPSRADGLRIAFLTDLHNGQHTRPETIRDAAHHAMEFQPDLVVLGGDYIHWDPSEAESLFPLLRILQAPLGCWGVLGNHDYADPAGMASRLETEAGIAILRNRSVVLGDSLWLGGIEDISLGQPDARKLGTAPDDLGKLVLSHNPTGSRLIAETPCLVLSGHTHGGQVLIPGMQPHRAPDLDNFPVLQGFVNQGNAGVYVSRGIGNTGLPIRFRCRPEVLLATLVGGRRVGMET